MQRFSHAGQEVKRSMMRGSVSVEFALLLIPLLLLGLGAAEYGRALYQYNALVKTVRDAARFLSQYNPADSISYPPAVDEARCLAVHGNAACSGPSLVPGLTTAMVEIASTPAITAAGAPITLIEVRITGYVFDFVFNPSRLIGDTATVLRFNDIHATMRQL